MKSTWISDNYANILQWAKNVSKGDELHEDLAHYAIETFMTHPKYEEICQKDAEDPKYGHCRGFILAIIRNSWLGEKSKFSRSYKLHRADIGHRKRHMESEDLENLIDEKNQHMEYDYEKDRVIEAIEGLLEEMSLDKDRLWYIAKLFQMYMQDPNYSNLSRKTKIPRTSISNAVEEAKQYIKKELKNRGIDFTF